MENNNKGRNYRRSNNWSSQDGINQNYSGRIKSRARSNHSKRIFTSPKIFKSTQNPSPPLSNIVDSNAPNAPNDKKGFTSGFIITGITIGSLIFLTIIVYLLIRFIKKKEEKLQSHEKFRKTKNYNIHD